MRGSAEYYVDLSAITLSELYATLIEALKTPARLAASTTRILSKKIRFDVLLRCNLDRAPKLVVEFRRQRALSIVYVLSVRLEAYQEVNVTVRAVIVSGESRRTMACPSAPGAATPS
ncbi:MAG: hypothetical protein GVY29_12000 [Spirochaetes bacterium]|jgi:hypothetical protein|nr:hypothetical protein [Spirochaetota bacterium]